MLKKPGKNIIISFLVIAVLFLLFKGNLVNKPKIVVVKNVEVHERIVEKTISTSGAVKSDYQANLSFPLTQKIIAINVAEGEVVEKGKLLAMLDTSQLIQIAQANKDSRDIAVRKMELFERDKEENIDSLGGSDQYSIRLRQYEEEVSQAEATYRASLANLNNAYLYASYDGTIVSSNKKIGETATAGETVFVLADLTKLKFEVNIDQEDFGSLSLDMPADINLDAYGNKIITAKVSKLPEYVSSSANNTFVVDLTFTENTDTKPVLGMTGDARIKISSTKDPVKSLFYDELYFDEEDNPYIWIVVNGYITKKNIEIGLEGDLYTEIKTDLNGYEIVQGLTTDTDIKDGYKVRIAK